MLTQAVPRNHRSAAWQIHSHFRIERTELLADSNGCARAGATGQGFADPPFEHAQQNMVTADDLHKTHIGAMWESGVPFDTRPKLLERGGLHIGHAQHRVRV